jgi:PAS domain S-box-containing protein
MHIVYILIGIALGIVVTVCVVSIILNYRYQSLLAKVSKKISDGYIIFNASGKITNYNDSILKLLELKNINLKHKNISEIFTEKIFYKDDIEKINEAYEIVKNSDDRMEFDIKNKKNNMIFRLEIMSIVNNDIFMRYVIMIKDVTKTHRLIEELHDNQDMMANREKFATLGQLISGIVHSFKSPIFLITGDITELNCLIEEYETSVGDPTVTIEDHYEIAKDMTDWIDKMKIQVENISDSITAIRSQVVTLNSDEDSIFSIGELIKYIDVLTKNTLKQYLIILNFIVRVRKNKEIKGNLNALVQVINNLIMNSVESYQGKPNQVIDVVIDNVDNNLEISVMDTGCGIPKKIQDKLFKEIITLENGNKTGLGLFMSYSNIKVQFGGDIKFVSEEGKGSTFTIVIPMR